MNTSDFAIKINNLSKKFLLFKNRKDKFYNALGIDKLPFFKPRKYQEFYALKGIEIDIRKGERVGIIGKNGSGKSTLLKIIAQRLSKTSGEVKIDGMVNALMELGTGFHPEFTGRENIHSSLAHQGYTQKEIKELEGEIIDFAEIEEFIDQSVKVYSAGMYTRLAFAVATTIKPDILIVDEVLGAGDSYFLGKSVERMKSLTVESGATVLFVSHDLSSVQMLCDRVIWINKGQIKMDGDPLDVIKAYNAMIREEEEIRLKARDLKISKKQAISLDKYNDIYDKALFRFVSKISTSTHPIGKIYSLSLSIDDSLIGTIDVGEAMDNNADLDAYILDDPEYMNWGNVETDEKGTYRTYHPKLGKYNHSPFEFSIPRTIDIANKSIVLNCILDNSKQDLLVQYYDKDKKQYVDLDTPKEGYFENQIKVNMQDKTTTKDDNKKESKKSDIDSYGDRKIEIDSVDIINADGDKVKTLNANEPFKVSIAFNTHEIIHNPAFVFCVYDVTGVTISQWIVSTNDIGINEISKKGVLTFSNEKLLIGKGSYVASVGIFTRKPEARAEVSAYHVMDRSVHFQIIEPNNIENIDYGKCLQPYEVELK